MQLKDVAVLITGGGSGLGAATARAMAAKGAKIGVIDQNKENAEKVAAEVKGVALHADVTDEDAIKAAIAKAEAAHGIARVLMNCAGIGGSQRTVGKDGVYPLAKFVRIINVNLIGTFNVLRLFAERLATAPPIGEERGVAINTASVAAYEGQIGQIAYSASKGGVVGLTLPAARDLASLKIRVNTIAPGLFLTPLLMGLNEEARKSLGAQVPHPARLGDASRIRQPRGPHRREPDAQRRDHPPRRRHPHGAAVGTLSSSSPCGRRGAGTPYSAAVLVAEGLCAPCHNDATRRMGPAAVRGRDDDAMGVGVTQPLLIEHDDGVDRVTLNRPDSLNALNPDMIDALNAYFEGLQRNRSTRVVVLKGAGASFCAGLDLKHAMKRRAGQQEPPGVTESLDSQRRIADIVMLMRRCPQPIIALVQGAAAGGGFALALAADIRIATKSARMNCAFIKLGLGGCDIGTSYFLPRLVGVSVASELILTGRFIGAERALAVGLVSEVVEEGGLDAAAEPYVDAMMTASPVGLRLSKECLNMSVDAGSIEAVIAMEDRNQVLCSRSEEFNEGIRAFLEKRKPVYIKR